MLEKLKKWLFPTQYVNNQIQETSAFERKVETMATAKKPAAKKKAPAKKTPAKPAPAKKTAPKKTTKKK